MTTPTPLALPRVPARLTTAPIDPDDVPAPVHPEIERAVLVRDAYGQDPYAPEQYGADGEPLHPDLGVAPKDLPNPLVSALAAVTPKRE